jgi:hypothetical protein
MKTLLPPRVAVKIRAPTISRRSGPLAQLSFSLGSPLPVVIRPRNGVEITQIVIDWDAGIVDEGVERADLVGRLPDLRGVGHVQRYLRHAFIGDLQRCPTRCA